MRDKGVLAYAKGKKLTAFADSRKIFSHYPAFSIQLSPILHPSSLILPPSLLVTKRRSTMQRIDQLIATAIIGIDTLWGGDVLHPSGTGRFIADCWFSDEPLPEAYTHPAASALRGNGGVSAPHLDRSAIDSYLRGVNVPQAIEELRETALSLKNHRGEYLAGLAGCLGIMYALALEILGLGDPIPYEECVRTVTGENPSPSDPAWKRRQLLSLLNEAGCTADEGTSLLQAVDAWRKTRLVPAPCIPALGGAFIALFDSLTVKNLLPYLPQEFHSVPRANIKFLPIQDAWFSGSMNYLGHDRKSDGSPGYEATYELNASLQISIPEFEQLVSHEVAPGHVTTFAFLQNLYYRNLVGFEASVLTMNTRASALFEGIANNAILMAYGVDEVADLPDRDLQIGVLLALLQDDAKNHASYLTWNEGWEKEAVAQNLRNEFLVSAERANKLSAAWGRHPLLGRMYLPAYRAGTEVVANLRKKHPPERLLPALYGCEGVQDIVTIQHQFPI